MGLCTVVLALVASVTLLRLAVDGVDVTRNLLQASERSEQGERERARDCLGRSLDRLIPDGARVRVRVAPPAAHRIIEALLPQHEIVEGDPATQRAWLIERDRAGPKSGCLRGLRVVAP